MEADEQGADSDGPEEAGPPAAKLPRVENPLDYSAGQLSQKTYGSSGLTSPAAAALGKHAAQQGSPGEQYTEPCGTTPALLRRHNYLSNRPQQRWKSTAFFFPSLATPYEPFVRGFLFRLLERFE